MDKIITKPALRIKMTGVCNRTCSFCNEEGDMHTIGSVEPDDIFFTCVHSILRSMQFERVMLTGGEPTLHPKLNDVVAGIESKDISITTNGIRPVSKHDWTGLKKNGLQKVIVSLHDVSPQSFLQLETRQKSFGWAVRALDAQKYNLMSASEAGLLVRVNVVAYSTHDHILKVFDVLEPLQQKYHFDIRLLNDLANIEQSQSVIKCVCQTLEAKEEGESRRAGSSNTTILWKTETGLCFSTKMAFRYFFDPICGNCSIKQDCHEGFYGIRLERKMDDYWVRLCIYKNTPDVLMPWRNFLESSFAENLRNICKQEQFP